MNAIRRGALFSIIGLVVLVGAGQAEAATGACDGRTARIHPERVIHGGPGNDVLIGSGRSQTILSGAGNDIVCAGGGNDTVHGQGGNDTIHGEGRGDSLFGDGGADRLYGDILDDKLMGGPGTDSLIGGHGVDRMFGGSGNDLLRGGTNRDCYYGDAGADTASFATATPPGPPGYSGVVVDLNDPVTKGQECPRGGTGRAEGDAGGEPLESISFVVGSAFDDLIDAGGVAAADAGLGADTCEATTSAAGCGAGDEKPAGTFAYVFEQATGAPADPGLVVRAPDGVPSETITVSAAGAGARVAAAGDPLALGAGCDAGGVCASASGALGYVLVYGADGADTIGIGEGLPANVTVDVDGGLGGDTIFGSSLGEVLFAGYGPGADTIQAKGGGDALISEGATPDSGPDLLAAGKGDDQLVTDYPCAGHTFIGGPGDDVAGFARSAVGIRARIGGAVTFTSGSCPGGRSGAIRPDNEVLEGTADRDVLIGSARADTIWGRGAGDTIIGSGGADSLLGFAGRDLLLARDGVRDRLLNCGSGKDRGARRDRVDPAPVSCDR
jgi:Ca2+-binding RTX toxin-like protein